MPPKTFANFAKIEWRFDVKISFQKSVGSI